MRASRGIVILVLLIVAAVVSGAAPAPPSPPAAPATTPAAPATAPNWYPLEVGHEWQYQIDVQLEVSAPGRPPIKQRVDESGEKRIDRVVTEFAGGLPTVEEVRVGWAGPLGDMSGASGKSYVAATESGVYLHAQRELRENGPEKLTKFSPPHRLLALPAKVGFKWPIGTEVVKKIHIETTGEILPFEDARTPAGVFTQCLKFRESGKLTGAIDSDYGPWQIVDGTYQQIQWLADGVGEVKGEWNSKLTVREPSGLKATVQYRLAWELTYHRTPGQ